MKAARKTAWNGQVAVACCSICSCSWTLERVRTSCRVVWFQPMMLLDTFDTAKKTRAKHIRPWTKDLSLNTYCKCQICLRGLSRLCCMAFLEGPRRFDRQDGIKLRHSHSMPQCCFFPKGKAGISTPLGVCNVHSWNAGSIALGWAVGPPQYSCDQKGVLHCTNCRGSHMIWYAYVFGDTDFYCGGVMCFFRYVLYVVYHLTCTCTWCYAEYGVGCCHGWWKLWLPASFSIIQHHSSRVCPGDVALHLGSRFSLLSGCLDGVANIVT